MKLEKKWRLSEKKLGLRLLQGSWGYLMGLRKRLLRNGCLLRV